MTDFKAIDDWLADRLTPDRYTHVQGVMETALHWAKLLQMDPTQTQQVQLAALLHDNAKHWPADRLQAYLAAHKATLTPEDENFPAIWHAWAGALEAREVWGIEETDVLNAIYYHTTGRPDMGCIEEIIFVADKTEPRTRACDLVETWRQQVRALPGSAKPQGELRNWVKVLLGSNLQYLAKKRQPIHPLSVATWNAYLLPKRYLVRSEEHAFVA